MANQREFGNVKSPMRTGLFRAPTISSEREPLSDVTITDREVKVVIEMPGDPKEKIKINTYQNKVEVSSDDPKRKYHEVVEIPPEADIESVKSTYNNGILEIPFKKRASFLFHYEHEYSIFLLCLGLHFHYTC